jgi:hypothetical protein
MAGLTLKSNLPKDSAGTTIIVLGKKEKEIPEYYAYFERFLNTTFFTSLSVSPFFFFDSHCIPNEIKRG